MQKINNKGFILAETLVVSLFIMIIFTMIYNNFFPLIGEYEKRENYDDVDGKYSAYLIKRLIESEDYYITSKDILMMNRWGYMRFNCSNINDDNHQRSVCQDLVKSLEISGCDSRGDNCDIFITRYTLGCEGGSCDLQNNHDFKTTLRNETNLRKWNEACILISPDLSEDDAFSSKDSCGSKYFQECCITKGLTSCGISIPNSTDYSSFYSDSDKTYEKDTIAKSCAQSIRKKIFNSASKDYLLSLPNFSKSHKTTGAAYRVIVMAHHKKDGNDYYSYSNMEVNK